MWLLESDSGTVSYAYRFVVDSENMTDANVVKGKLPIDS